MIAPLAPKALEASCPRTCPYLLWHAIIRHYERLRLEFLNGPSQSMSRPVHRVLSLIGSASGCKFRLTDPSVSRFHCSLLQTPAGLWIVDLLGQRGITVNEVPVRSSRLVDGDVSELGGIKSGFGFGSGIKDQEASCSISVVRLWFRAPRQDRDPQGIKLPDWTMAAMSFEPMLGGAKEAHGSLPTQLDPSLPKAELMASNFAISVNLGHSGVDRLAVGASRQSVWLDAAADV